MNVPGGVVEVVDVLLQEEEEEEEEAVEEEEMAWGEEEKKSRSGTLHTGPGLRAGAAAEEVCFVSPAWSLTELLYHAVHWWNQAVSSGYQTSPWDNGVNWIWECIFTKLFDVGSIAFVVGVVGVVGDVLLCFWKQEEEFVLEDVGVEWEQEWSERQNPPAGIFSARIRFGIGR